MSNTRSDDPNNTVITKTASCSVDDAVTKLCKLIESHGLSLFAIVDHGGEARRIGLELRDMKVVIFGSPASGTPVMQAVPLIAIDLPLKVLIWDDDGQTRISFTALEALAARYNLNHELALRLVGIGPITDALAAA